jgi:hypothetical protein
MTRKIYPVCPGKFSQMKSSVATKVLVKGEVAITLGKGMLGEQKHQKLVPPSRLDYATLRVKNSNKK